METTKLKPFTLDAAAMRRWFFQEAGAPRLLINVAILLVARVAFQFLGTPAFITTLYFVCYLALGAYAGILGAGLLSLSATQKKFPYTEQAVEFDDANLTAEYGGERGTTALSEISQAKEFKEFFALTIGGGRLYIPKSAFEDEADLVNFRENLRRETKYQDRRKMPLFSWQIKR